MQAKLPLTDGQPQPDRHNQFETKQLKDFVKEQLKVHQEGGARFFTDFHGEFTVGAHNLLRASDDILISIGDGQPDIESVKKFFTLVDNALESIFNEIMQEEVAEQTQAIKAQRANIKSSMAFKLSSFSFREKTDEASILLRGQSSVLISLADAFFVKENINLAEALKLFYESKLNRAINCLKGEVLKVDRTNILSEQDLTKFILDSKSNFNTLPATYRQKISTALWEYYSFKTNPYPFTLGGLDDLVISELSRISLTTVESMANTITNRKCFDATEIAWMKNTPISDVAMGPNYEDKFSYQNFDLTTTTSSDNKVVGLIVSGRDSDHHELRGRILREIIAKAKLLSGNKQSVYDALQVHLRTLELNTSYLMLESLITNQLLSQQQDFISDFDNTSPVYQEVKVELLKRILIFAKEYSSDAANFGVKFIENDKLTTIGKNQCEAILIEINNRNPLPSDLVSDLNAIKLCKQRMVTITAQLEKGNPFKLNSPGYNALHTLHQSLGSAYTALQGDDTVDAISNFNTACHNADFACEAAIQVAKNPAFLDHPDAGATSTLPVTNPLESETTHQPHTTKRNWKTIGGIVGGIIYVVVGVAFIVSVYGAPVGAPLVAYGFALLGVGALLGSALGAIADFVSNKQAENKPGIQSSPREAPPAFTCSNSIMDAALGHPQPPEVRTVVVDEVVKHSITTVATDNSKAQVSSLSSPHA